MRIIKQFYYFVNQFLPLFILFANIIYILVLYFVFFCPFLSSFFHYFFMCIVISLLRRITCHLERMATGHTKKGNVCFDIPSFNGLYFDRSNLFTAFFGLTNPQHKHAAGRNLQRNAPLRQHELLKFLPHDIIRLFKCIMRIHSAVKNRSLHRSRFSLRQDDLQLFCVGQRKSIS